MTRLSHLVAAALCVALMAQVATARLQLLTAQGSTSPLNIRTPDPCAQDFLFRAAFNPVLQASLPWGTCVDQLPVLSSTLLGPSVASSAQYSLANTYPIDLTGTDFDDLFVDGSTPVEGNVAGAVCLAEAGMTCAEGCDANAGTRRLIYISETQLRFEVQPFPVAPATGWLSTEVLLEARPRELCYFATAALPGEPTQRAETQTTAESAVFTGFHWGAVYACATNADCGSSLLVTGTGFTNLQEIDRRLIQGQTQCCQGQCINPNVQGCCGNAGTAFELANERCCDGGLGVTQVLDGYCPCSRALNGGAPTCPSEAPSCCLPTRFTELVPTGCNGPNPDPNCFSQIGQCYNPLVDRCCDTGSAFNPGEFQCCSITGLQDAGTPCPCQSDTDCEGGATQGGLAGVRTPNFNLRCCTQTAPGPSVVDGPVCSAYQNFPVGSISFRATRCSGTCFDSRYQICCNGATCIREFEQCCNATCCNLFTSTCFDTARRAGQANIPSNFLNFGLNYQQCSTIENLETVSVFWVYIVPAAFLIATLASLALTLVFTSKASVRMFSFLEKMIIAVGIIVVLVSCALYFSPAYKYGIVFSLAAMTAIVASAARVRWVTIVALVAVAVSVWYLLDPWHGNDYLTLAYWRLPNGQPDPRQAGLFHALDVNWPERDQITDRFANFCVYYYNYFALDAALQDNTRFNNPLVPTFGYCTRGWITALLVLAGVLWASLVFLFCLLVLALILRFRKDRSAPIELEVRPEPFIAPFAPVPIVAQDPFLGAAPFVPVY